MVLKLKLKTVVTPFSYRIPMCSIPDGFFRVLKSCDSFLLAWQVSQQHHVVIPFLLTISLRYFVAVYNEVKKMLRTEPHFSSSSGHVPGFFVYLEQQPLLSLQLNTIHFISVTSVSSDHSCCSSTGWLSIIGFRIPPHFALTG